MELLEFGHAGRPILVFPTSRGRFYEYEDRGMIAALASRINAGKYRVYCVDSVDAESWYAYGKPPGVRVWRHIEYEKYLLNEVLPLVWSRSYGGLIVTGCSFGGYHCVNLALKHPDIVTSCVSMGGAFDLTSFMHGYSDQNFYLNQPLQYLPNLNDGWFWDRYQKMGLVLATGEWDICLNDNVRLSRVLSAKSIPHYLDIWGSDTGHDWPWWQQMSHKFFT
jgi:esterase/lipase superfamily enzyme